MVAHFYMLTGIRLINTLTHSCKIDYITMYLLITSFSWCYTSQSLMFTVMSGSLLYLKAVKYLVSCSRTQHGVSEPGTLKAKANHSISS